MKEKEPWALKHIAIPSKIMYLCATKTLFIFKIHSLLTVLIIGPIQGKQVGLVDYNP